MKRESVKKMSYEEAVAELEAMVKKIEDPTTPLDKISADVEKALELVKYCRSKLRDFETSIAELKE